MCIRDRKDKDFCKEVIVGWKDVVGEKNEEIPFSPSALEQLMEIPGVSKQLVSAFLESIAGSKLKNL